VTARFVYQHRWPALEQMEPVTRAAAIDNRDRLLEDFLNSLLATTPWTAPTLLNAWANSGAPLQVAEYRKVGDRVDLRGCVTGGTIGLAIFTLPTGFRPPANVSFAVNSTGAFGALTVTSAGAVVPSVGTAGSFHFNVSFYTTS
jgi:hypothetical protein